MKGNPEAVEVSLKSHLKFDPTVQSQHQPPANSLHQSTEKLIFNFNVISVFNSQEDCLVESSAPKAY